jgi:hypothetical protein
MHFSSKMALDREMRDLWKASTFKPGKFHMADWEATKEAYQRPLSLMMRRWVG